MSSVSDAISNKASRSVIREGRNLCDSLIRQIDTIRSLAFEQLPGLNQKLEDAGRLALRIQQHASFSQIPNEQRLIISLIAAALTSNATRNDVTERLLPLLSGGPILRTQVFHALVLSLEAQQQAAVQQEAPDKTFL